MSVYGKWLINSGYEHCTGDVTHIQFISELDVTEPCVSSCGFYPTTFRLRTEL